MNINGYLLAKEVQKTLDSSKSQGSLALTESFGIYKDGDVLVTVVASVDIDPERFIEGIVTDTDLPHFAMRVTREGGLLPLLDRDHNVRVFDSLEAAENAEVSKDCQVNFYPIYK